MKITLTTKYAVRAAVFMAQTGVTVNSVEISLQTGVPKDYLMRLLQKGVKAGIFQVTQGIHGGYNLQRDPGEITLMDIMLFTQGPLDFIDMGQHVPSGTIPFRGIPPC